MSKFARVFIFAAGICLVAATAWATGETFQGFDVVRVVVNGRPLQSDVPAVNFYGRIVVPVRFIGEALGASVKWDSDTHTASIDRVSAPDLSDQLAKANTEIGQLKAAINLSTQQLATANAQIAQVKAELEAVSNLSKQVTFTYSDGSSYVGQVKDGLRNGQGTYTWTDGTKYVGDFKDGKLHGQGTYTWTDGSKYVGDFKDDQFDGTGVETHPDGFKLVGEYRAGKADGLGVVKRTDGSIQGGLWTNGQITSTGQPAETATVPVIPVIPVTPAVIESRIDGTFEGWTGDTIFKLINGQIWQQASYAYTYHYAYSPKVLIYQSGSAYTMTVDGVTTKITVKRLK